MVIHKRKFDESVMTIAHHPSMQLLVSGGADGTVNVFETFY